MQNSQKNFFDFIATHWKGIAISLGAVLVAIPIIDLLYLLVLKGLYNYAVGKIVSATGLNSYLVKGIALLLFMIFIWTPTWFLSINPTKRRIAYTLFTFYGCLFYLLMFYLTKNTPFIHETGVPSKYCAQTPEGYSCYDSPGYDTKFGLELKPITPEDARSMNLAIYPPKKLENPKEFFHYVTGKPVVWYYEENGIFYFYDQPGHHPLTGDELLPVTKEVVEKYKKQLESKKLQEQSRLELEQKRRQEEDAKRQEDENRRAEIEQRKLKEEAGRLVAEQKKRLKEEKRQLAAERKMLLEERKKLSASKEQQAEGPARYFTQTEQNSSGQNRKPDSFTELQQPEPRESKDLFEKIQIRNVDTSCSESVKLVQPGSAILGSGWCFYRIAYPVKCQDYTLRFNAKLEDGDGYGIWFRGDWQNNRVRSLGVQFDPGAGGLKFVKYPETESSFYQTNYACDNAWHQWNLMGVGAKVKVFLDGKLVLDRENLPGNGLDLGFRTWRGKVHIKNLEIGCR